MKEKEKEGCQVARKKREVKVTLYQPSAQNREEFQRRVDQEYQEIRKFLWDIITKYSDNETLLL